MNLAVKEIFFSYQAEGPYIGTPMIFIRFAGCNLRCYYCDTKESLKVNKKDFKGIDRIIYIILNLVRKHKVEYISITGGEPLIHKGLYFLIEKLKNRAKVKIYLETNSTLFNEFKKVIDLVDICAINLKIPCDDVKKRDFFLNTEKIVKLCKLRKKEFFIKIVVSKNLYDNTTIRRIKSFVVKTNPKFLVLQPETKSLVSNSKTIFFNLSNIYNEVKNIIPFIHITPQMHKFFWGIR